MSLENIVWQGGLLDCYGALLTDTAAGMSGPVL